MIYILGLVAVILGVALDQFTKYLAVTQIKEQPIILIDGVLEFRYLENRGAAFGMLQNQQWFFLIITVITLCLIVYTYIKLPREKHFTPLRICMITLTAAKENGVLLSVFQQTFYAPYYLAAKQVADSGILGDILQVNVAFNGFARRWDWQTLQMKMGGSVYNTGPHPIGIALGFLDFDEKMQVVYSKLDIALSSGDAEDYAKMILTAPGKPVVDVEINSTDAFSNYNIKIQGTKGTYQSTPGAYKMKYVVDGENPERPVVPGSLMDEEGLPIYCSEKLITHEEEGTFDGNAFNVGTRDLYKNLYDTLNGTRAMEVTAEHAAKIINVIETVHAQNPLPVKY